MEKIFPINPYDDSHIRLVESFEAENNLTKDISNTLTKAASSMSKKEYESLKKHSNTIEEYLMLNENSKIKDICHLQGEKDRKICRISFPSIPSKIKAKKILLFATNYAMNNLGMIEVLIDVDETSKSIGNYLENNGYENLGVESSKRIYLKEKESKRIGEENHHETIR